MPSKIKIILTTALLSFSLAWAPGFVSTANAQLPSDSGGSSSNSNTSTKSSGTTCAANDALCASGSCTNSTASNCIDCSNGRCTDPAATSDTCHQDPKNNCDLIADYLNPTIRLLNIVVGIVAVISIGYAGIQYSMAGGDPQKVAQAKSRLRWTVFALVVYAFLYGFIQFLIPGGAFNNKI